MKRIVVPLDGSGLSERAMPMAKAFARAYRASLELVQVRVNEFSSEAYLQDVARSLSNEPDLTVTARMLSGETVRALLDYLSHEPEAGETMVIMSTHGRGGLGRLMLGSVADEMIRAANIPIVLVRDSVQDRRPRLQTLLVPVDESDLSKAAVPHAVDLARRTGSTIDLVRVCEPAMMTDTGIGPGLSSSYAELIVESERAGLANARRSLDQMADEIRSSGVWASWELRSGRAADEIIRMAETTAADLIIMATHGRGGVRRFVLGSVTDEVLRRGTTPILVVPGTAPEVGRSPASGLLSTK